MGRRENTQSLTRESPGEPTFHYCTIEEGLAAYEATPRQSERCYRELAKGPGAPPSLEELIEAAEREVAEEEAVAAGK